MKKIFILPCFIACFISCNQSSLEIDFSNISDPCEFLDAVEIFVDDYVQFHTEATLNPSEFPEGHDMMKEMDNMGKQIQLLDDKIEEISDCFMAKNWTREEMNNCSGFDVVYNKIEEEGLRRDIFGNLW